MSDRKTARPERYRKELARRVGGSVGKRFEKGGPLGDGAPGIPGNGNQGRGVPGIGNEGRGGPGVGKPGAGKPGAGKPGAGKPGAGKPGRPPGKVGNLHWRDIDHGTKVNVNIFVGSYGYGFGFYYGNFHHRWWGHYGIYLGHYPYWFWHSWWYPYWGYAYYPYYWSYLYYPTYRVHHVYVYEEPYYTTSGYYYGAGFDDDPYYDEGDSGYVGAGASRVEEAPPPRSRATDHAFASPFVEGVDAGATATEAIQFGNRAMAAGEFRKAAEAYRQAFHLDGGRDALRRMSMALFAANDPPLASAAMVLGIGGERKGMLDYAVLIDELLPKGTFVKSVAALERYLVDEPNDEASNLLLGALYVLSGREYAGYIVLTRLKAAGYETSTVNLFIDQARTGLMK